MFGFGFYWKFLLRSGAVLVDFLEVGDLEVIPIWFFLRLISIGLLLSLLPKSRSIFGDHDLGVLKSHRRLGEKASLGIPGIPELHIHELPKVLEMVFLCFGLCLLFELWLFRDWRWGVLASEGV